MKAKINSVNNAVSGLYGRITSYIYLQIGTVKTKITEAKSKITAKIQEIIVSLTALIATIEAKVIKGLQKIQDDMVLIKDMLTDPEKMGNFMMEVLNEIW